MVRDYTSLPNKLHKCNVDEEPQKKFFSVQFRIPADEQTFSDSFPVSMLLLIVEVLDEVLDEVLGEVLDEVLVEVLVEVWKWYSQVV